MANDLTWRERLEVAVGAFFRGRDVIGDKAVEAMKAGGGSVSSTRLINYGNAKSPETRLEPLIKNGWRRNELIFACVSKKANTASQIRLTVVGKKDETEIENHPLRMLIARPNPMMTETTFFASIIILQDFSGNAYFEKVRSRSGRTVELWPIRPDWMKAYIGQDGMQAGWVYQPPGLPPHYYEMEDILPFRTYDPLNEYFGYPPVAVASRIGDLDNATTDYVRMVFEKGGVPPGILTSTQPITEAIAERIRAIWREKYGGFANWDAPVVLGHDTKYQSTGLSFEQMGLEILDTRAEVRICMTLKVPPTLINSKIGLERAIESNVKEIQRNWWDNDLIPIYKQFADSIRDNLLTLEYPEGVKLKWDYSEVPALQEDRDKTRELFLRALSAGGVTRNQFNVAWDLPELGPRGEVFIMSAMQVEVPIKTMKVEQLPEEEPDDTEPEDEEDETPKLAPRVRINLEAFYSASGVKLRHLHTKGAQFPAEKSKAMRAVEKKIETKLAKYLKGLNGRLLDSVKELTSHRDIKQDATQGAFWSIEQQVLFELLFPLFKDAISNEARSAYDELAGMVDLGVAWDVINDEAWGWANTQTTAVVQQITKTSMAGFLQEFEPWLKSGEPLPVLIEKLEQYYSPIRASMIAITETTRAFATANLNTWRQFDMVVGFDVLTAEDADVDDICHEEQARNPHALDDEHPPYHVNCRCSVRPVVKE